VLNHTLFISDLHLEFTQPKTTELFLQFLEKRVPAADALYILGDFFEMWVGDDDKSAFNESIKEALRTITRSGLPVYFMRGNRDFLIGEDFAKSTGCRLLPDPSVIQLYGHRIVLTHGDILCTQDTSHLRFRKWVHNPSYHTYFFQLPLFVRKYIAKKIRGSTKKSIKKKDYSIMDVTPEAVTQMMSEHQVKQLIHGHTHRPHIHTINLNGEPATRIVLGAWHDNASALVYYSNGHFELI
jgi:UDP-2,3-diacylglucosamine hydrolase